MATTRQTKTPPTLQPAREPVAPPLATPAADGVGDRGVEQAVPFYTDSAGRRFVAAPHKDAGKPW